MQEHFLQGQLTCNIEEINETQMRQGALCNLQGRIISLMDVLKIDTNTYYLILPKDLIDITIKHLSKPALFSKVKVIKGIEQTFFGLYIQKKDIFPEIMPYQLYNWNNGRLYAINSNFIFGLVPYKWEILEPRLGHCTIRGSLAWHFLQLKQKIISIYLPSVGLFLPHRLGLQNQGYISFNKGCYRGQEIIARTHYRAKLKHIMALYQIHTSERLFIGQKIYNSEQTQELGELIDTCPIQDEHNLIAISILTEHDKIVMFEGHSQSVHLDTYS